MSSEAPNPFPEPPAALRKQGLTRAEDNVGSEQTLAVPGSVIFRFFGPELMARFGGNHPSEKGERNG
jgi:hypothetical protein